MKILIACEYSGRTRNAFAALGHDVISADFEPAEDGSPYHYQGDCFDLIADQQFDLMIAHPPCTYLSVSGLHWNTRGVIVDGKPRAEHTEDALRFVQRLMDVDIPRIAIENPVSCISSRIRKPDQVIQPYMFGHMERKATCLWLKGLPKLTPTDDVKHQTMELPANERDKVHYMPPSADRWKLRSTTYRGIADAMASQWG